MDDDARLAERRARLQRLQAKMSESASANRQDVAEEQAARREHAQKRTIGQARKLAKAERILDERDLREAGKDVERHRAMNYTIEENEAWEAKLEDKERTRDKGAIDFQDLAERSYRRQIAHLKPDLASYEKQKEAETEPHPPASAQHALIPASEAQVPKAVAEYGAHRPDEEAVDRLVSHLNHEQDQIRRRSRRRNDGPDAEITYINEKNKHFNKKIKRYYDEHTKEIRENLERGTAFRVCRAGLAGECAPRVLMDVAAAGVRVSGRPMDALYAPDQMRAAHPRQLQERHRDLTRCLVYILRTIYQEHLVCDATAHDVLLVHGPLWVEAVQDALCGVLLGNLGVPRVSFVDTHTLALLAVGRNTGLVVDCGYWETVVMPVYAGRPLRSCLVSTPRAGRRLGGCVEALVRAFATCEGTPLDDVPAHVVERVVTEALLVGPMPSATCDVAWPIDVEAMRATYGHSDATDWELPTDAGRMHIPGWIRTAACEALLERGDEDEAGIVECARECIARLPIDVRREVLDAILLTGGTAMLPGLATRFEAQLHEAVAMSRASSGALPAMPRVPIQVLNAQAPGALRMSPIPPNVLAWTGASLAASIGASGAEQVTRAAWRITS
ncbi:SYF2 splicing factor [Malassezia brasiliensis]|uniref:Pre-mRNA-splicing factor SYF2 n=1 Tax=Malassezia brasiliensis TaxID=1821822 RepID=A0AAF0DVB3_9BASI|nr:SYF2 splicing factor [Malassezia brasiliensis]